MQRRCLMQFAGSRAFRLAAILTATLAAGSCSKDDIPTTPPPPFLFSNVQVSKNVAPPATKLLVHGTPYVAKFDVAYTLDPSDDARRTTLQVSAVVNSHDANGIFLAVIGRLAFIPPTLSAPSGVFSDSIAFTVPASGASFISVGAEIVNQGSPITDGGKIGPFWSVQ
jgi:hypothetical protein